MKNLMLFVIVMLLLTIVIAEGYYTVWAEPFRWVGSLVGKLLSEVSL